MNLGTACNNTKPMRPLLSRLPPGQVYGRMAETMLLGLEGVRDATFTGFLPAEHVFRLAAMAKRHGFALAEYKTHATMGAPAGTIRA